jgi:hypothetical protein
MRLVRELKCNGDEFGVWRDEGEKMISELVVERFC